jgi:hypothetical protein
MKPKSSIVPAVSTAGFNSRFYPRQIFTARAYNVPRKKGLAETLWINLNWENY